MDLTGKKILICEEALVDHRGHFFTWIKAIRAMHLQAGASVFVAGSSRVDPDIREDLRVLPVYSVNSWDQSATSAWSAWRRYLRVVVHNWRVFMETRKALIQTGPVDVVFFTAVRVHHLIGLRLLCLWGLGSRFNRLVPFLLTSQALYESNYTVYSFPPQAGLLRIVLKSFAQLVARNRVILAGDSHITCAEYERLTGLPQTLFPSPGANLTYERRLPARDGPVFVMLGVSTWDKGIDVLQAAIILFLRRNPDIRARFVVQWGVPCVGPDGLLTTPETSLRADSRVSIIERRLTDSEYAEYFGQADFIVLPYRRSTYFNRISGVAVEAACSGKPMIVTANTWLEWAMEEFGFGLAVPEADVQQLCAAMEQCCCQRAEFSQKAKMRASTALEYNSTERYLSLLWQ